MSSPTPLTQRIDLTAALLGLVLAVIAGFVAGPLAGASLAMGAAIGAINFALIRVILARTINPGGDANKSWAVMLGVKFLALAAAIYVAIGVLQIDPLPFVIGISCVLVAVFFESLRLGAARMTDASDGNEAA